MKLEFSRIQSIFRSNPRRGWSFGCLFGQILALVLFLHCKPQALYLGSSVTAYRVANGSIVMDGRPDLVWKAIGARLKGADTISFGDYSKIVLLKNDAIRNADPAAFYNAPAKGSVVMMAAYDNTALYFFFLVKENTFYNPSSLCTVTKLWQANSPEVYIDPAPWDMANYYNYFSPDGSNLFFGTSPKSVQLNKSIHPSETRIFFRNRSNSQDRFQTPTSIPGGVIAISSPHTIKGDSLFGVEMKIPFWTGNANDFTPGKSMYISWGYNHYPNAGEANCDSTPIAYRWAKHFKSYNPQYLNKPYGWRAGDSTHFDPTRSWDGWGKLSLNPEILNGASCQIPVQDSGSWALSLWGKGCYSGSVAIRTMGGKNLDQKSRNERVHATEHFFWDLQARDLKGRKVLEETHAP